MERRVLSSQCPVSDRARARAQVLWRKGKDLRLRTLLSSEPEGSHTSHIQVFTSTFPSPPLPNQLAPKDQGTVMRGSAALALLLPTGCGSLGASLVSSRGQQLESNKGRVPSSCHGAKGSSLYCDGEECPVCKGVWRAQGGIALALAASMLCLLISSPSTFQELPLPLKTGEEAPGKDKFPMKRPGQMEINEPLIAPPRSSSASARRRDVLNNFQLAWEAALQRCEPALAG